MLKIKTEDITISKIIENYRSGLWSIPESLSDYEWKKRKSKAATFIANLYQGRPVSSIMIWESPEAINSDRESEAQKHVARVLDGQQKIMTLCKVIDGASDLKILFNPRITDGNRGSEGQIRVESTITKKSEGWVDVGKVLGSKEDFCSVLRNEESDEHWVRFLQMREILNREISVVKYLGHDYVSIAKAFELWKMKKKGAWISV